MEDNDKCIILKRKEYYDLVAKAESKKPDYINICLYTNCHKDRISSNLVFSDKLSIQLFRIIRQLQNKINSREIEIIETAYKKIANMSRRERRKFLKQYE